MTSSKPSLLVWVLADDRTGNANQALGVAEALGFPFEVKRIEYNRWGRLPSVVCASSLLGVQRSYRAAFKPPWPDIVIAAGRRTVPVARHIKRANLGHSFLVHIMWPGWPTGDLNLLAVPEHDFVPERDNVIHTVGAPHRVTAALLAQDASVWRKRLAHLPRPYIGVLVGGTAGKKVFDVASASMLGQRISQLARDCGGTLLVTTSRRTGVDASEALISAIDAPNYVHRFTSYDPENPFFAFLGLSDAVVVTGDSTSMCSEACATGRPVYIFAPPEDTAAKHRYLHQCLYTLGYARPLTGEFANWSYPPLNAADRIAQAIRERVGVFLSSRQR